MTEKVGHWGGEFKETVTIRLVLFKLEVQTFKVHVTDDQFTVVVAPTETMVVTLSERKAQGLNCSVRLQDGSN